jgi:hypothetical protein
LRRFALRFAHHRPREIEMNTKTTRRLASGTIANSGRFWVVPTQGPRLTDRHDLLGPYRAEGSAGHVRDKYLADGIPCEVIDSDERPVIEQAAHADQPIADDIATGLRALADMIEANPQHADLFRYTFSSINAFAADPEPQGYAIPSPEETAETIGMIGLDSERLTDDQHRAMHHRANGTCVFDTCPLTETVEARDLRDTDTIVNPDTGETIPVHLATRHAGLVMVWTERNPKGFVLSPSLTVTIQRRDGDEDNRDFASVSIQPEQNGGVLPYPYHVDHDGNVGRQDYWKGNPAQLAGFLSDLDVHEVDLLHADFWLAPQAAVGMYPVFIRADGSMFNLTSPVASVTPRAKAAL